MNEIKIGDRVRSFDFSSRDLTGERACYVEGVVENIATFINLGDVLRYDIKVDRTVWSGKEEPPLGNEHIYPVVNCTRIAGGDRRTDFVVKIEEN